MSMRLGGSVISAKDEQVMKAFRPIVVTVGGSAISVKGEQPLKASVGILAVSFNLGPP